MPAGWALTRVSASPARRGSAANGEGSPPRVGPVDAVPLVEKARKPLGRTAGIRRKDEECNEDTACAFSDTGLGSRGYRHHLSRNLATSAHSFYSARPRKKRSFSHACHVTHHF